LVEWPAVVENAPKHTLDDSPNVGPVWPVRPVVVNGPIVVIGPVVVVVVIVVIGSVVVVVVAVAMPFIAAATMTTTLATSIVPAFPISRSICGTGLVGPFPQLAILVSTVLRVLYVITVIALDIAPSATCSVRALTVALYLPIGVSPCVMVALTTTVLNG